MPWLKMACARLRRRKRSLPFDCLAAQTAATQVTLQTNFVYLLGWCIVVMQFSIQTCCVPQLLFLDAIGVGLVRRA